MRHSNPRLVINFTIGCWPCTAKVSYEEDKHAYMQVIQVLALRNTYVCTKTYVELRRYIQQNCNLIIFSQKITCIYVWFKISKYISMYTYSGWPCVFCRSPKCRKTKCRNSNCQLQNVDITILSVLT
jgi:hypothetical protein